jgi:SAM-dependent methyltransferase
MPSSLGNDGFSRSALVPLGTRLKHRISRHIFDLGSAFYAWMTWQPVWRAHCAGMADFFPPPPTPTSEGGAGERLCVLDIGIGPGVSGIGLLDRRPDLRVIGADFSAGMLRHARRYLREAAADIPLCRADVMHLPFRDGAFDVVTHHSFLYLLVDREAALREMARVLKPGGSYVILEPHRGGRIEKVLRMSGPGRFKLSMFAWRIASGGYGQFQRAELVALLERHGFVDVEVEETLDGLGLIARARKGAEPA